MNNVEIFKNILKKTCSKRFDVDKFLDWLENKTDFFIAPASSKYHLSEKEGLLQHSLNVYNNLSNLCELYYESCPSDTIAIVALLHDLCKTNFYKQEFKNVKVGSTWTSQLTYTIDDQLPLGHGEKSVMLILSQGISLTQEEMLAIRWHMSGYDNAIKGGDLSLIKAYELSPLVSLIQVADIISTYVTEKV